MGSNDVEAHCPVQENLLKVCNIGSASGGRNKAHLKKNKPRTKGQENRSIQNAHSRARELVQWARHFALLSADRGLIPAIPIALPAVIPELRARHHP